MRQKNNFNHLMIVIAMFLLSCNIFYIVSIETAVLCQHLLYLEKFISTEQI